MTAEGKADPEPGSRGRAGGKKGALPQWVHSCQAAIPQTGVLVKGDTCLMEGRGQLF